MGFTAAAVRPAWALLPLSLRSAVEQRLGAGVVSSVDQPGGFTHGAAARLLLADGSRAFVKAIPVTDELVEAYRAEASCAACLPERVPAPRFRFWTEVAGWLVLAFDDVAGRSPRLAKPGDLHAVLATIQTLAEVLTPNPVAGVASAQESLAPLMCGWRTFATRGAPADLHPWSLRNLDRLARLEGDWAGATAGDTLLHADLRPDNMVLTRAGTVAVVDWACVCVGAPWVDLVVLLGSVAGLDNEAIVRTHPVTRGVEAGSVDAFVAALLGCWETECRRPELPRSPQLRRFQTRNAAVTRAWLSRRTGWA